ncbi:hypothetical protein AGMMS4952_15640 [Spirochaetia bacterium]|nr:hypothetical protein AGMMS4952_15640 [Spirochaetia bacterium]
MDSLKAASVTEIRVLKLDPSAWLPEYASDGAAGADLKARVTEPIVISPLGRARIPTGLALEIPPLYEAQVRPRSGLAAKWGGNSVERSGNH